MSFLRFIAAYIVAATCHPPVRVSRGCGAVLLTSVLAATMPAALVQAQPIQAQSSGTVVRVIPGSGKVAIRHPAISKLDLPAMTLVYHLDPALLAGIKAGDKVDFTAERRDGQYRIVALEKQ